MRLSNISLAITALRGNWWDAFREGGFNATLILSFKTDQYYNEHQKDIADLVTSTTAGLRATTLANGDIGWGGHNLLTRSIPDAGVPTGWSIGFSTGTFSHTLLEDVATGYGVQSAIRNQQTVLGRSYLFITPVLAENSQYTLDVWFDPTSSVTSGSTNIVSATSYAGASGDLDIAIGDLDANGFGSITFTTDIDTTGTIRIGAGVSADTVADLTFTSWHLYRSDLGGMQPNSGSFPTYFPTTTAAYYAPAIHYDPVTLARKGVQIERAGTNLVLQSHTFDTTWSQDLLASNTEQGNGSWLITDNTTNGAHGVSQTLTVSGDEFTVYLDVEDFDRRWLRLQLGSGGANDNYSQVFDLENGVLGTATSSGSNVSSASAEIEDRGNGVYRCILKVLYTGSKTSLPLFIRLQDADLTTSYIGDGSGVYLHRVQAETGDIATSYIPTAGATASRVIDELSLDSVPSEVELVTNGGFDTDLTGWTVTDGGQTVEWSAGKLHMVTDGTLCFAVQPITTVIGRTYTASVTVDVTSGQGSIVFGGVQTDSSGVGEQTISSTFTATSTSTTLQLKRTTGASSSDITFDEATTQELVPFVGFDGTQGTWVLKGNWVHNDAATAYMLAGDTSATRFAYQTSLQPTDMQTYDGTTVVVNSGIFADNTDIAVVMSYLEGGTFNILADGSSEATASLTGDLATPTVDIGHLAGANGMHGIIYEILWYPAQLDLATRQGISV